jgi:hypothetical protein
MKRLFTGVFLAVLLGLSGLIVSQRAFSEQDDTSVVVSPNADATPIPFNDDGAPDTIEVGEPLPSNSPDGPTPTPIPTVALPAAPATLADDTALASYDFDSGNLAGWQFGQIIPDPISPPAWTVEDGHLKAPLNDMTNALFNDTLAVAPAVPGATAAEVSALTRWDKVGLVMGYQDDNNYVALVLNAADTTGYNTPGLVLVQEVDGQRTTLAQDATIIAEANRWYTLRLELDGATVRASVDGTPQLTAELAAPLAGERVGVYGASEGLALFDNLRVIGE